MNDRAKLIIAEADCDEAYEAHRLAFPDDKWCGDVHLFWLARRGGTVVGFLSVFADERGVFISRVAVALSEQNSGLGRRLVRLGIRYGKRAGHKQAYTYTLMKNYSSMCMLLKCGFRFVEPPKEGQYHGPNIHYFARAI
jgi:GNAT superfamily N-acetyltransferase